MSMVFLVYVVSRDKWYVLAAGLSCNLRNRRLNITIIAARFLMSVFWTSSLRLLLYHLLHSSSFESIPDPPFIPSSNIKDDEWLEMSELPTRI